MGKIRTRTLHSSQVTTAAFLKESLYCLSAGRNIWSNVFRGDVLCAYLKDVWRISIVPTVTRSPRIRGLPLDTRPKSRRLRPPESLPRVSLVFRAFLLTVYCPIPSGYMDSASSSILCSYLYPDTLTYTDLRAVILVSFLLDVQ